MGTRRVFFHLRVAFFFSQMTRFTSSSSTGSCYRSQSRYTYWVVHLHGYYQIQRPCMGGREGGCGKSNHKSPTWKLDVRRTFCERGKIWFFFSLLHPLLSRYRYTIGLVVLHGSHSIRSGVVLLMALLLLLCPFQSSLGRTSLSNVLEFVPPI